MKRTPLSRPDFAFSKVKKVEGRLSDSTSYTTQTFLPTFSAWTGLFQTESNMNNCHSPVRRNHQELIKLSYIRKNFFSSFSQQYLFFASKRFVLICWYLVLAEIMDCIASAMLLGSAGSNVAPNSLSRTTLHRKGKSLQTTGSSAMI